MTLSESIMRAISAGAELSSPMKLHVHPDDAPRVMQTLVLPDGVKIVPDEGQPKGTFQIRPTGTVHA